MGATWAAVGRAAGYLVVTLGAALVLLPLTLPVMPLRVRLVDRWARWHRTRAALLLGAPVPQAPAPETDPGRLGRWLPFASLLGIPLGLLGLVAVLMPPSSLQFLFWWALPGELTFLWLVVNDPITAACATAGRLVGGLILLRWALVPAARVHARLTLARLTPSRAELLAARGLVGALDSLAGRTSVPVRLDAADPGRLPVAVETAAYFVVTEAVANAVRHGSPTAVDVRLVREGDVLRLRVSDDGTGGVDEERGRGIRHRVAALDGTVRVSSPAGGPTVVAVELPCGS